jgi:hypothetical protein
LNSPEPEDLSPDQDYEVPGASGIFKMETCGNCGQEYDWQTGYTLIPTKEMCPECIAEMEKVFQLSGLAEQYPMFANGGFENFWDCHNLFFTPEQAREMPRDLCDDCFNQFIASFDRVLTFEYDLQWPIVLRHGEEFELDGRRADYAAISAAAIARRSESA